MHFIDTPLPWYFPHFINAVVSCGIFWCGEKHIKCTKGVGPKKVLDCFSFLFNFSSYFSQSISLSSANMCLYGLTCPEHYLYVALNWCFNVPVRSAVLQPLLGLVKRCLQNSFCISMTQQICGSREISDRGLDSEGYGSAPCVPAKPWVMRGSGPMRVRAQANQWGFTRCQSNQMGSHAYETVDYSILVPLLNVRLFRWNSSRPTTRHRHQASSL